MRSSGQPQEMVGVHDQYPDQEHDQVSRIKDTAVSEGDKVITKQSDLTHLHGDVSKEKDVAQKNCELGRGVLDELLPLFFVVARRNEESED